jgi:hypothetical protein
LGTSRIRKLSVLWRVTFFSGPLAPKVFCQIWLLRRHSPERLYKTTVFRFFPANTVFGGSLKGMRGFVFFFAKDLFDLSIFDLAAGVYAACLLCLRALSSLSIFAK